jgi:predicted TIM-barrel fold metal-dependent hydrolase
VGTGPTYILGVLVVDAHHHYLPHDLVAGLEGFVPSSVVVTRVDNRVELSRRSDGFGYAIIDLGHWCDAARQIEAMHECGVGHAVLSPACFSDWLTPEAAALWNRGVAEVVAVHPDRFSALVAVCPDDQTSGERELDRWGAAAGFVGVNMTTSYRGRYPDHPSLRWLFAAAARRDLTVFIHPSWNPPTEFAAGGLAGWDLERTLGKVTDLTLALARMMYDGVLTGPDGPRVAIAHLGGSLPMVLRRLFFGPTDFGDVPASDFPAMLRRIWVDTAPGIYQGSDEIAFAASQLGAEQVIFGSDYPVSASPLDMLRQSVGHVAGIGSAELRSRIFSTNALDAFPGLRHRVTLPESSRRGA